MKREQFEGLLYQALETERGGVEIYTAALECAQNEDLRGEWEEYLAQTRRHEGILIEVFEALKLDPEKEAPGRDVVRHIGESLVAAIEKARAAGEPKAAEIVAAECVVLAETKDHANWELLSECAGKLKGGEAKAVRDACDQVEDEEDEHLYHTMGWARELWMDALGLPAVLPPPEEEKDVKTAIGAARAKQERKRMAKS
jgi:rubrerythrin